METLEKGVKYIKGQQHQNGVNDVILLPFLLTFVVSPFFFSVSIVDFEKENVYWDEIVHFNLKLLKVTVIVESSLFFLIWNAPWFCKLEQILVGPYYSRQSKLLLEFKSNVVWH